MNRLEAIDDEIFYSNTKSTYENIIDEIIQNRKKEIFAFFNSEEKELPFNIYVYDSSSVNRGMGKTKINCLIPNYRTHLYKSL